MPRKRFSKAKQLTVRDKNILTDLARCRVLSAEQIKKAYWPTAKERTCDDRLKQLQKAGYITEHTVNDEKPGSSLKVYSLSTKGKRWATGPEGPGLDKNIVFTHPGKANEIVHQVRTNDVYFQLSDNEKATWRIGDALEIEHGVYAGGTGMTVPDAAYTGDDGEEIYVETDCGKYTPTQIRDKVAGFGDKKVVWVCPAGREQTLVRHGAAGDFVTYVA
ncbi:replication-relaxation family protein [Desulfallas thermosapovorans]|uniref:Protein involved in plasmid replication-relaxation n=1 Tax=Desulfallas thermosapovorans DSM 6562 TaxID=1121431 RepID=A0A5S4ZR09_9FIRM|nr:replication-relaxation family protein [Desulfallas thermosapovorans]TYO94515.1 protein involved in plasmid replication-relaxation [Desulfallas thermosapovorans DSM 6562]